MIWRSEARAFVTLCGLLSGNSGSAAVLSERDWDAVVALSKRHRVAPALWRALRQRQETHLVPPGPQRNLEKIYYLNERRNRLIIAQTTELVGLLNTEQIEPTLLKTLVNMIETDPKDLGRWTTRDIDLLVPRERFLDAVRLLQEAGYVAKEPDDGSLHTYPPLVKSGEVVEVDLHRDIGIQRSMLAAEEALAGSVPVAALNGNLRALSPTHRMLHLLFHDQIQDRRFELARISLHQLSNFHYLVEKHGDAIEWQEISTNLASAGYGSILPGYSHIAHRLLGTTSAHLPRPRLLSKVHYWRCIVHLSVPTLQSIMAIWETLTPYMSKNEISYFAGDGGFWFRLRYRMNYAVGVWRRHGLTILPKIVALKRMREKLR